MRRGGDLDVVKWRGGGGGRGGERDEWKKVGALGLFVTY